MSGHVYLSTGCLHGDMVLPDGRTGHEYCQGDTGAAGAKVPAQCKFCGAACRCVCHRPPPQVVVEFPEDWTEQQRAKWRLEFGKRRRAAERRRGKAARQLPVVRELTAGLLALRARRRR